MKHEPKPTLGKYLHKLIRQCLFLLLLSLALLGLAYWLHRGNQLSILQVILILIAGFGIAFSLNMIRVVNQQRRLLKREGRL